MPRRFLRPALVRRTVTSALARGSGATRTNLAILAAVTAFTTLAALGSAGAARAEAVDLAVEVQAEDEESPRRVEALDPGDVLKSDRQRRLVDALVRRHLGGTLGTSEADVLGNLQRLIDGGYVAHDEYAQQALGVVLGDVLVREAPSLSWVAVQDRYGHSRALRYRNGDPLYFPVTMISKRVGFGEPVIVRELYDDVRARVRVLEEARQALEQQQRGRR